MNVEKVERRGEGETGIQAILDNCNTSNPFIAATTFFQCTVIFQCAMLFFIPNFYCVKSSYQIVYQVLHSKSIRALSDTQLTVPEIYVYGGPRLIYKISRTSIGFYARKRAIYSFCNFQQSLIKINYTSTLCI